MVSMKQLPQENRNWAELETGDRIQDGCYDTCGIGKKVRVKYKLSWNSARQDLDQNSTHGPQASNAARALILVDWYATNWRLGEAQPVTLHWQSNSSQYWCVPFKFLVLQSANKKPGWIHHNRIWCSIIIKNWWFVLHSLGFSKIMFKNNCVWFLFFWSRTLIWSRKSICQRIAGFEPFSQLNLAS